MPPIDITVIRPSASRPVLLLSTHDMFLERVHSSGKFHFVLHEDELVPAESAKGITWADEHGYTVLKNSPPIGQGASVKRLLEYVSTKYCFHFEDDWLFLRDINLDEVLQVMEENPNINEVCFNKRPTMGEKYGFIKEQVDFNGFPLVVSPHWTFLPAVWRTEFIQPFFNFDFPAGNNFTHHFNSNIKRLSEREPFRDHHWMKANVGAYFWGRVGNPTYVQHLGLQSARLGQV